MSLLLGQQGSKTRQDYVQFSPAANVVTKGHFMDPNRPSSLGVEDRSRFRPQAYVAPRQIELMQGSFNVQGVGSSR